MKKSITTLALLALAVATISNVSAKNPTECPKTTNHQYELSVNYGNASITFKNMSDYFMTIRILYSNGGYYGTVTLPPYSSRSMSFSRTASFKMKIKAATGNTISYHDGGHFSVTCNDYEYSEGTIEFMLSTHGTGLGPKISEKEFLNNN